ncbi:hypothetical protein HDU67_005540 [Dinochytrium kinnereticum]|nr:hypothetical protein HDU67_005540 [Dinochytrium kinnereticum]
MGRSLLPLLLAVVLSALLQLARGDPCSLAPVVLAREAVACYQSFELQGGNATRSLTIEALRTYLNLYPYLNIPKMNSTFDIVAELDAMQTYPVPSSEYGMHSALTRLFALLHDAHTLYQSDCFSTFQFLQPWIIGPRYKWSSASLAEKPRLYVRNTIFEGLELDYFLPRINITRAAQVSGLMQALWNETLGAEPGAFVGYEIISIDGRDPVSAVQSFADEVVGLSRDPDTRFNAALGRMQFEGGRHRLIEGPFVSASYWPQGLADTRAYVLRPPSGPDITLRVPWLAYFVPVAGSQPFPDPMTSTFYRRNFCGDPRFNTTADSPPAGATSSQSLPQVTAKAGQLAFNAPTVVPVGESHVSKGVEATEILRYPFSVTQRMLYRGLITLREESVLRDPQKKYFSKQAVTSSDVTLIFESKDHAAYFVNVTKTGILVIPSFSTTRSPFNSTRPPEDDVIDSFSSTLRKLAEVGAQDLLIDVSGNSGGNICLGKKLAKLLAPDVPYAQYDVRLSPTNLFLMRNGGRALGMPDSNPFSLFGTFPAVFSGNGTDFITRAGSVNLEAVRSSVLAEPLPQLNRGIRESYSRRFVDVCSEEDVPGSAAALNNTGPRTSLWPMGASGISVLSNGLCGSTCAIFVRVLRNAGVRTLVYGGASGNSSRPLQPTSYEGGRVLDQRQVLEATQLTLSGMISANVSVPPDVRDALPRMLPWPASMVFLHWEAYTLKQFPTGLTMSPIDGLPDEWVRDPGDQVVDVEDPIHLMSVWTRAAMVVAGSVATLTDPTATPTWGRPDPTAVAESDSGGPWSSSRFWMGAGIAVSSLIVFALAVGAAIWSFKRRKGGERLAGMEGWLKARPAGPSVWRVRSL